MKNLIKSTAVAIFILFSSISASASSVSTPSSDPTKDALTYSRIINRVTEIQGMDKTNLSADDKKDLRRELTKMKKEAAALNSRVYLSVGAIIIAILLLILILN
ncbi:MAG: hypothetical protein WKF88_07560 [Ferruginibacter sp.]